LVYSLLFLIRIDKIIDILLNNFIKNENSPKIILFLILLDRWHLNFVTKLINYSKLAIFCQKIVFLAHSEACNLSKIIPYPISITVGSKFLKFV
jgi:hypothetical protein